MRTPGLAIVSGSSRIRTAASLNHALYAAAHGIPYFFDAAPSSIERIYLHKLHVVRSYLPLVDWLFWLDDDAFFTDFRLDLRTFLADADARELVFCSSPLNLRGGWTWMSSGQFFIRHTPEMLALLDAVLATDLARVKAWWDPATYGLFTNGDQDAFVYQLMGPDQRWRDRFVQLPADAFNNRPYHYERQLDEHFICHFAMPGPRRPKAELVGEFAARLGSNHALCPPELIEPYREFLLHSDMGPLLGIVREGAAAVSTPPQASRNRFRRAMGTVRSAFRR